MEQLREKMMNQTSVAGVQKYMHQFNKGTRKDKNGKGTGNHKNDIVFKEVENSFGNKKKCGSNLKHCQLYGNAVYEYHERTKKKNCRYPVYEIMLKDIHDLTTLDVSTCEYRAASIEEIKDFCRSLRNTFETYCLNRFMGKDRVVYVDWNTNVEMPEDYSYRNTDYGFYRSVLNRIEEIENRIQ